MKTVIRIPEFTLYFYFNRPGNKEVSLGNRKEIEFGLN